MMTVIYCHECNSFLDVDTPAEDGMMCPECGSYDTDYLEDFDEEDGAA